MHPDSEPTPGARDPRQPGPASYAPAGPGQPGLIPTQPGHVPVQPGDAGAPPWRPPVPVSPSGHPLAGFGDRFLAYLIDALILSLVSFVLVCPLMILMISVVANAAEQESEAAGGLILLFFAGYAVVIVLQFAFTYLYFVEYQLRSGQTVGKRVMSLRVLPVDPRRTLDRAILARRFLVQFVAGGFVPLFSLVDGLWQLWDQPLQQTLHDKAAETVVAKVVQ